MGNCVSISADGFDRRFSFYFEGRGPIVLRAHSSTPRTDLLASIREAVGAPMDEAPLRLRDETGALVAVSSAMPSSTYYVTVESGMKDPDTVFRPVAAPSSAVGGLLWDASSARVTISESGAFLKGNGEGCESWWAFSSALPSTGIHYISLSAEGPESSSSDRKYRPCCISIGFVPTTQSSVRCRHLSSPASARRADDDGELKHFVSLMGIGGGDEARYIGSTGGSKSIRVGILVDCSARTAVFINHDNPASGAIRVKSLPKRGMKLCINAPKHVLEARFLNLQVPAGIPSKSTLPLTVAAAEEAGDD